MLRFEASQELNLGSGCSLLLGVRSEGKEGARQQLPWLNSPQLRVLGVCCALCSSPAPGGTSRAALSLWRGVTPGAHPPAGIPGAAVAGREPSPFQLRVFRDLPQKTTTAQLKPCTVRSSTSQLVRSFSSKHLGGSAAAGVLLVTGTGGARSVPGTAAEPGGWGCSSRHSSAAGCWCPLQLSLPAVNAKDS